MCYLTTRTIRVNVRRKEVLRDKELLRLLKRNGWKMKRIKGSHHILVKGNQIEVVPVHGKEVPTGLLQKIMKRTGLMQEE